MVVKIFKRIIYFLIILMLLLITSLSAIYGYFYYRNNQQFGQLRTTVQPGNLGQFVEPFIGTGGYFWVCANNFPGTSMPFGVARLSPDTYSSIFRKKALNTSGYYFPDNRIMGFSHTRLSGTGATDGGHFRIIPTTQKNGWQSCCICI